MNTKISDAAPVAYGVRSNSSEWRGPVWLTCYMGSKLEIEHAVMRAAHREGFIGIFDDRMKELGWWIEPVYEHPHLAADAVPVGRLPDYVRSAISGLAHIAMKDAPQVAMLHVGVIDNWLNSTHPQPAALNEVGGELRGSAEIEQIRNLVSSILGTVSLGHQTGPYAYAGEDFGRYLREATSDCRAILAMLPALAATGKQQGGEVQADALATLQQDYDNLLAAFDRQVAAAEKIATTALEQDDRIEELEEALAARQPVGQEPKFELRICEVKHTVLRPNRTYSFTVDPNCAACRAQAAYAVGDSAPPAQGIDLSPIATRKLGELAAQGYVTNGVAIFNPATGHRGLVDNLGFVGWMGAQGVDLESVLHKAVDLARGGSSAIAVVGWITGELLDQRDAGVGVES